MDVAYAVVGAEVEVIADAPFLVQARPDIVLIPALHAFGAEEGGEEKESEEKTHAKDESDLAGTDKPQLRSAQR
jgi:hypothetical protein